MAEIVRMKPRVRPLQSTYEPSAPYIVERVDDDSGVIYYEVNDTRPDSFRHVCSTDDGGGCNAYAKHDAEQIARALNLLVQYGKESLPAVREAERDETDDQDEISEEDV